MKAILFVTIIVSACAFNTSQAQQAQPKTAPTPQINETDAKEEDDLITDRPDFTESPQTVDRKYIVQLEAGYTHSRESPITANVVGEMLFRIPVANRMEMRLGVPDYIFSRDDELKESATGFDDGFIGAKVALLEGSGKITQPAVGLLFGTSVPIGARLFREDKLQPELVLAASTDLAESIALSSNIGYVRASDAGERFNQFFGSLSLGIDVSRRVGAFAEVYGFTRTEAASRAGARYADSGLTFLVNKNFQLDGRAGVGIGNKTTGADYFFGFGFARRF